VWCHRLRYGRLERAKLPHYHDVIDRAIIETDNVVNRKSKTGGYDHVSEYIPIGQPNAGTLAKLSELRPGPVTADREYMLPTLGHIYGPRLAVDALIVGIETQALYLATKKTWTRKIALVSDGENPIEIEDWDTTVQKMNQLEISLTVVYRFLLLLLRTR
jgi:ATP-dependent DNA helicase 2 subunit 2